MREGLSWRVEDFGDVSQGDTSQVEKILGTFPKGTLLKLRTLRLSNLSVST